MATLEVIELYPSPWSERLRWVLEKGATVLAGLGSANRDPAVFPAPDRLELGRSPNPHLAFGMGTHACPGAQLRV